MDKFFEKPSNIWSDRTTQTHEKQQKNNIRRPTVDAVTEINRQAFNQYVQETWSLLKMYKIGSNGCFRTQSFNVKLQTQ